MSKFKKFKSINKEISVSNTLGHSAVIGKEYTPVHESLWGEAYSKGAVPEDVETPNLRSYVKEQKELKVLEDEEKKKSIKVKLLEIYNSPNDYLNKNGDLILRKVSAYLKEPIKADVILEVWDEIVAENK